MTRINLGEILQRWAVATPSVSGLTVFGSRARGTADLQAGVDDLSDWDFQIISSRPSMFLDRRWAEALPGATLRVYAPRMTKFGGVPKVNLLFDGAEADVVVISSRALAVAKALVALGLHRRPGRFRRRMQDLANVSQYGVRFLKGAGRWEAFYRRLLTEAGHDGLGDDEARRLADLFVCEYLWSLRKIDRGELVAVQRMLHRELAETNFALFHEERRRRGARSFPDGRRVEQLASADVAGITVNALCDAASLRAAIEASSATLRRLMHALVGDSWSWPEGLG